MRLRTPGCPTDLAMTPRVNPIAHIDPIGTLLIPIVGFVFGSMGGTVARIPLIGWGKPTPVNPLRWRDKDRANVMVSAAGIIVNTFIAICAFTVLKVMLMTGGFETMSPQLGEPVFLFLQLFLTMNISLAVFNLLPFPPLDGSKILETFLPASAQPILTLMEQYGFIILMMLIYVGFFGAILRPIMDLVYYLLLLGVNR